MGLEEVYENPKKLSGKLNMCYIYGEDLHKTLRKIESYPKQLEKLNNLRSVWKID